MLDTQIHMYLIDTGTFYSNHEKYLHDMNCKYRRERNYINNKLPPIEQKLIELGYSEKEDFGILKRGQYEKLNHEIIPGSEELLKEYAFWNQLIIHKREKAHESKEQLLTLLSNKMKANISSNGKDHIRHIREDELRDNNVISVFESSLTRTIGIASDDFTEDLMTVQVYYFDVFKDLVYYGYLYKGEKYKYFTSSAGQIRKKKAVFIKESTWNRIEKTIMCGLTIEQINKNGGNNVN